MNVKSEISGAGCDPGKKIEYEKTSVPHMFFYSTSEEIQEPHIPDDVYPAAVQNHICKKRNVMFNGEPVYKGPLWIGILCGDKTEEIKDPQQEILRNRYFKNEDHPVYGDQQPYDKGEPNARDGVLEGDHRCLVLCIVLAQGSSW